MSRPPLVTIKLLPLNAPLPPMFSPLTLVTVTLLTHSASAFWLTPTLRLLLPMFHVPPFPTVLVLVTRPVMLETPFPIVPAPENSLPPLLRTMLLETPPKVTFATLLTIAPPTTPAPSTVNTLPVAAPLPIVRLLLARFHSEVAVPPPPITSTVLFDEPLPM